jgi:hypothetical protein
MKKSFFVKILLVFLFGIAFAYVEAAVVAYLRTIYYPAGFHFPLVMRYDRNLTIEFFREFATLVILFSSSVLLSRKFWEGFGYFVIIFGVWDIFYYVWLKVTIGWPASVFDPDVLFLIPMPWIGPVLSAVLISLTMIIIGIDITRLFDKGYNVKPGLMHWVLVLIGSVLILYSFMSDWGAAFFQKYPKPYNWFLLAGGLILFISAHIHLHKRTIRSKAELV